MFQVNPLLMKIKPDFLRKIKVKNKISSAEFLFSALRIKRKNQICDFGLKSTKRDEGSVCKTLREYLTSVMFQAYQHSEH